jgi:hypothetical protein
MVVNLGDDTDTTDAIYGQIPGAYTESKRSPSLAAKLACRKVIESPSARSLRRRREKAAVVWRGGTMAEWVMVTFSRLHAGSRRVA